MKYASALSALVVALASETSLSQECPTEYPNSVTPGENVVFSYAVVGDYLCGHLEYAGGSESWLGFGVSPNATMNGGDGILGMPDGSGGGHVSKWMLTNVDGARVQPLEGDFQTLGMGLSFTQADGKTTMTFAKLLKDGEENEIVVPGTNVFLYAVGSSNDLGYHASRGDFTVDLEAPSESDESETEEEDPSTGTNTNDTEETTEEDPAAGEDTTEETSPTGSPPAESGAMASGKTWLSVFSAGAIAIWFGM